MKIFRETTACCMYIVNFVKFRQYSRVRQITRRSGRFFNGVSDFSLRKWQVAETSAETAENIVEILQNLLKKLAVNQSIKQPDDSNQITIDVKDCIAIL